MKIIYCHLFFVLLSGIPTCRNSNESNQQLQYCLGITRHMKKCKNKVKYTQQYCHLHDPAKVRMTDPSIFRNNNIRLTLTSNVLKLRDNIDIYTDWHIIYNNISKLNSINDNNISNTKNNDLLFTDLELDHIIELQCVTDTYDALLNYSGYQKISLFKKIKKIVNSVENLNFTTQNINIAKCEAMIKFLEAYKTYDLRKHDKGINEYLLETNKLSSSVAKNISNALLMSSEYVVDSFDQENVIEAAYCDEFQQMFFDRMKLK